MYDINILKELYKNNHPTTIPQVITDHFTSSLQEIQFFVSCNTSVQMHNMFKE